MKKMARKIVRRARGFTLIELIVAIAIIGILAAIAVPSVLTLTGKGEKSSLEATTEEVQQAVDRFNSDKHKGPSAGTWGLGANKRWFPTKTGLVGNVELAATTTDPDFTDRKNPRVQKFVAGSAEGANAVDADIKDAAVWAGLLVNDAANDTSSAQTFPGSARPQGGEPAQLLLQFPKAASEFNSDTDAVDNNGNGKSSGSSTFIVLQNGKVEPAYKGSDTNWYVGFADRFP